MSPGFIDAHLSLSNSAVASEQFDSNFLVAPVSFSPPDRVVNTEIRVWESGMNTCLKATNLLYE